MKKLLFLVVLFIGGCTAYVKSPLTIREIRHEKSGVCRIQLDTQDFFNQAWVTASGEGCNYKVGDVLK